MLPSIPSKAAVAPNIETSRKFFNATKGIKRLFNEIQDKSRQLAEPSQHKSQFLANMSHELRSWRRRFCAEALQPAPIC
jgi:signal transduction histidine kinase